MKAATESVHVWRAGAALCMRGTTSSYAVDPNGEYVVGMVLAGGMEVRRGGERHRFGPGDLCAWDPSAAHAGRPWGGERWQARLIVLEPPAIEAPAWALERETALSEWLSDLAAASARALRRTRRARALRVALPR